MGRNEFSLEFEDIRGDIREYTFWGDGSIYTRDGVFHAIFCRTSFEGGESG